MNIPFPLRSHSIRFSTSSYSFKLESDCKFCNEVTTSCDHHVIFVRLSDWANGLTVYSLSHHAPVKVPKSKYNLQCLNLKLTAEGILHYFSNKALSMTSWKFLVQQERIIIWFACIVLRQIHVHCWTRCSSVLENQTLIALSYKNKE